MPRPRTRIRPVLNIPEECDDECRERIIRDVLDQIYPQLRINALKVASDSSPWLDDILPHAILAYMEKPLEYRWKVVTDEKLEEFITYVMNFQLKSSNSPFFHKYRQFNYKTDKNIEIDTDETGRFGSEVFTVFDNEENNKQKIARLVFNELNFYEQDILTKVWIEGWSQVRYAEHYGIVYKEFLNNVCGLKNKIKRILNTKYKKYLV